MKPKNTNTNVQYLTYLGALVGLLFLLELTPLGILPIVPGTIEITTLMLPVVIGAIVLGPTAGGILGAVFGLISFWECFGKSAFGVALFSINPLFTFLVCVPPRILMGLFSGLIFQALNRKSKGRDKLPFVVGALSGAVVNTVLFMTMLMVLFGNSDIILGLRGGMNVLAFVAAFVGFNGIVEAIVCGVIGSAVGFALYRLAHRK